LNKALEDFQITLKKLTKEQIGSNSNIEELLDMFQNHEQLLLTHVKTDSNIKEIEAVKQVLVMSIISIMDQMENIYRF
jgi:ribonuclease HI